MPARIVPSSITETGPVIPSFLSAVYGVVCPVAGNPRAPEALAPARASVAVAIMDSASSFPGFIVVFLVLLGKKWLS